VQARAGGAFHEAPSGARNAKTIGYYDRRNAEISAAEVETLGI